MLYDKIRYAAMIRKMYRLKYALEHKRHTDFAPRFGYAKYSRHYYVTKNMLRKENILDEKGRFVNTILNIWMAELAYMVKKDTSDLLGFRNSYEVYLALMIAGPTKTRRLARDLGIVESTAYCTIKKLQKAGLIKEYGNCMDVNKDNPMFEWLSKYLEISIMEADVREESSILFNCVPGYIDGLEAYYRTHYLPGRPLGHADMILRSSRLYHTFWEYAMLKVRYFKEYPKDITIMDKTNSAEVTWLEEIPYNRKARR